MASVNPSSNGFAPRLAVILVTLIAAGFLVILGKRVLCPLFFALLFSVALHPLARFFEARLHFRRALAAAACVILLECFLGLIIYFIAIAFDGMINDWPHFKGQLFATLSSIQTWAASALHIDVDKQKSYIDHAISGMASSGTSMAGQTLLTLTSILLFIVLLTFYIFFLLYYRALLLRFFLEVFEKKANRAIQEIVASVQRMIRKYITGLLLEMLIVGTTCTLGFTLLGIKYALFLGPLTGVLNVIPYVGIFTSLAVTAAVTLASAGAAKAALVAGFMVAVHLVDSNLLLPFIVGSKVRINALITLMGVVIGEMMWGIPGMFLSIPVLAIAKIVFDRVEGLKEWGTLLGEERPIRKRLRRTG